MGSWVVLQTESREGADHWNLCLSGLGDEEKIQTKQKRITSRKREGIGCVKCGWELKKEECWVNSVKLDDKEATGVARMGWKIGVGLRSDEYRECRSSECKFQKDRCKNQYLLEWKYLEVWIIYISRLTNGEQDEQLSSFQMLWNHYYSKGFQRQWNNLSIGRQLVSEFFSVARKVN